MKINSIFSCIIISNYFPATWHVFNLAIVILLCLSCHSKYDKSPDGIYVEKGDRHTLAISNYLRENKIYNANNKSYYAYDYIDKQGVSWKVSYLGDLVNQDSMDIHTIELIFLNALAQRPGELDTSYYQTTFEYYFINKEGNNMGSTFSTGLIENNKNIWIHPFRTSYNQFNLLQLNPYPFFVYGEKSWDWSFYVGDHYSAGTGKSWKGNIKFDFEYEKQGNVDYSSNIGKIKCTKIQAKGTSEVGNTTLTYLFNKEFGFVDLKYENIDGSKFHIYLDSLALQ